MAGYDGYSKSNNAINAERKGLMTASTLAKRIGKGVKAGDIKAIMDFSEWHHTSAHYNVTNYYACPKLSELKAIIALAKSRKVAKTDKWYDCEVKYLEWGGSKAHPKATEITLAGCAVEFKGSTYRILPMPGKGPAFSKRKGTRGLSIVSEADGRIE